MADWKIVLMVEMVRSEVSSKVALIEASEGSNPNLVLHIARHC